MNTRSSIEPKEGCVATTVGVIGNKWTALILRDLSDGSKRFSELERSVKNISPRALSKRLDDLEVCQIITKSSFAEVPPRIEYTLTQKGRDLEPILKQMASWGDKYSQPSESKTPVAAT